MTDLRYILCCVLGLVLALSFTPTEADNFVPVLLWGSDLAIPQSSFVNPFQETSQSEFETILTNIVGGSNKPIVVFLRDNSCVEDFRQSREGLMHIKDGAELIYLPAVDSPLAVFQNLPSYNHTMEEEVETVSDGQLVITEADKLNAIPESFSKVRESSPGLVGALIGKSCTWSASKRERRATVEESTSSNMTGFVVNTTRILMYASLPPTLTVSDNKDVVTELNPNVTQAGDGTDESPLQLNFEYSIKNTTNPRSVNVILQFPATASGYYYAKAFYKEGEDNMTLRSQTDIVFPYNFSYHCSQNVRFGNATFIRFDIADFQVQIDGNNFNDAYDCVGFTSMPIWSGIFVTAILALITIWGLTMIMDIRTMDRFDDPKGKTITVSSAE